MKAIDLSVFKTTVSRVDSEFEAPKTETTIQIPFSLMTKQSFKSIFSLLREVYPERSGSPCGHEWDCCGCVFRTDNEITFSADKVTIETTEHRNF